jgi:hypothetical protein
MSEIVDAIDDLNSEFVECDSAAFVVGITAAKAFTFLERKQLVDATTYSAHHRTLSIQLLKNLQMDNIIRKTQFKVVG